MQQNIQKAYDFQMSCIIVFKNFCNKFVVYFISIYTYMFAHAYKSYKKKYFEDIKNIMSTI